MNSFAGFDFDTLRETDAHSARQQAMSPELKRVQQAFEGISRQFSDADWLRTPQDGWNSIAIAEHLFLSFASTTLGLLKVIHSEQTQLRTPTRHEQIGALIIVTLGYFPKGQAAPPQAQPKGSLRLDALARVMQALTTMDTRLAQAEQKFGRANKILLHPGLGPLSAHEWRRFHLVHGLHHINQMKLVGLNSK